MTAELLKNIEFRLAGPFRGGRVGAVAGDPSDPRVFYFGSTGGGVWKTTDGGVYWQNVSDGFFQRASVGAIACAAADPNVLYVGMGESCLRGNVSPGDGVYRSPDAGKTWSHLGLADTRHISKVRVHPRDPNLVYVAALGHAHGPNGERGIFRSRDGGNTWDHVLFRSPDAGANDLSMDPHNPRVLYASFWETRRAPWGLTSGGPGSGLFKSTDGGDTWTEISRNKNLPKGVLGKIGVCASGAQPDRVFAIVEAEDGAVFRSDGRAVPRHHRHAHAVPPAWSPAGQHHHFRTEPLRARGNHQLRELGDRRWRERLHRRPAGRSERDLRRQLSRLHDALRPSDRSGPRHRSVAGGSDWRGRQGSKVPIPVDLPDRLFAARSKRAVCHGQPRLSLSGRRQHVGSDQPGPDPQRPN